MKGDKIKRFSKDIAEDDFNFTEANDAIQAKVGEKESMNFAVVSRAMVFVIFCLLVFRLFIVQVVSGDSSQALAEGNRIRPRLLEATRGIITDNNGVWLARNKPEFALVLYPSDLPKDKEEREKIYKKVAELSGVLAETIKSQAEENGLFSLNAVFLKEDIPHDEALILEKNIFGLAGVKVAKLSSREYSTLPGLSHLIGYTGKVTKDDLLSGYYSSDKIGKTGIEYSYESDLKGKHGVEQIEVDSRGNLVRVLAKEGRQEPADGQSLSLYLDSNLQLVTANALSNGITEAKKNIGSDVNAGVAIVMDVNSGGILSMVSAPAYDNNLFTGKMDPVAYQNLISDKSYPMLNRGIAGTYPPGSIVKIVMASAGLAEHVIEQYTSFNTPAEIKIGDYIFPDWKDHSYESTNVERAIAESNNVFFYSVGGGFDKIDGLGIERMKKYWQLFGMGEKTGIDLPSEASGLLPDPAWKKKYKNESWYIGDTYHASIGQGYLLVTPIQMLRATAVIANGGKLLSPQLVKKIIDNEGNVIQEFGPRIVKENFLSVDVIDIVQNGMRMAVTQGSARNMADLPVSIAAKTGTAQFLNNQKTHAWFECYAPYENPQIAVIVMVEGGGGGNEIAAPVAKEILNYYFTR